MNYFELFDMKISLMYRDKKTISTKYMKLFIIQSHICHNFVLLFNYAGYLVNFVTTFTYMFRFLYFLRML